MTGQMFRARAMMEEHKSGLSSQQFSTILGTPDAVLKYKSNLPLDDAAVMIFEGMHGRPCLCHFRISIYLIVSF